MLGVLAGIVAWDWRDNGWQRAMLVAASILVLFVALLAVTKWENRGSRE